MQERNKKEIRALAETIDFTDPVTEDEFEDAVDVLAQFLLFGTKWESVILKDPKARRRVPIISDIPLICKADDCVYAKKCPILKGIKKQNDKLKLIGTECRADRLYAIQEFTAFVRDLQIDPEQTTDIINVASLVRLLIIKRRIDWQIAIDGIMDKEPGVVDPRTGQVYFRNVVHPLLKTSESITKQMQMLQKQLMADRQARAALASALGQRGSDVLKNLFSGNFDALEADNPIDAEFSTDGDEEE